MNRARGDNILTGRLLSRIAPSPPIGGEGRGEEPDCFDLFFIPTPNSKILTSNLKWIDPSPRPSTPLWAGPPPVWRGEGENQVVPLPAKILIRKSQIVNWLLPSARFKPVLKGFKPIYTI
jgi:hypothetical protein